MSVFNSASTVIRLRYQKICFYDFDTSIRARLYSCDNFCLNFHHSFLFLLCQLSSKSLDISIYYSYKVIATKNAKKIFRQNYVKNLHEFTELLDI